MGPDRLSSYTHSRDYGAYSFENNQKIPGQLPNSKDVLQAMERGDLNEAMRLLNREGQAVGGNPYFLKFIPTMQMLKPLMLKGKIPAKLVADLVAKLVAVLVQGMFKFSPKQALKEGAKQWQQIVSTLLNKLAVKIVEPCMKALQAVAVAFKQLVDKVVDPITNWITPKAVFVAEKIKQRAEQMKATIEKAVNWVEARTAPFRESVKEISQRIVATLENFQESMKNFVQEKLSLRNIGEEFSAIREKAIEKLSKFKNKVAETASDIKETVTQAAQTVIQVLQDIPAIVVPFAFWFVKQVVTPVGNIKENIRHFAKKAKNGLKWMGEKASSVGKFLQEGGEALSRRCVQGWCWFRDKILPLIVRVLIFLKKAAIHIFLEFLRVLRAYIRIHLALTRRLASALKSIVRGVRVFSKRRIPVD